MWKIESKCRTAGTCKVSKNLIPPLKHTHTHTLSTCTKFLRSRKNQSQRSWPTNTFAVSPPSVRLATANTRRDERSPSPGAPSLCVAYVRRTRIGIPLKTAAGGTGNGEVAKKSRAWGGGVVGKRCASRKKIVDAEASERIKNAFRYCRFGLGGARVTHASCTARVRRETRAV